MEIGSIVEKLENKCILITGSTGFLAKLLIEKVLRVQPNVKKLFLLVRAADAEAAKRRVETEIMQSDLFKVVRKKYGKSFEPLFWSKVTAVPGNVALEGLGIRDEDREEIWRETNLIVNLAATTNFNERYDVALGINTFGVKNILAFSMNLQRLEILVHVSTAYVTTKKSGIISEQPLQFHDDYKSLSDSDISMEANLVQKKLQQLKNKNASPKVVNASMKELGMRRANLYGWQNAYSFTKALGEVLLCHLREDIPVVILRPTIVTSTFLEPFPGWIEGVRTIDIFIAGYSKGEINCCPANGSVVLDLVPGDMVVNALLAILAVHAGQPTFSVYQIGSSMRNPLKIRKLRNIALLYFVAKPCIGKTGMPTNCRSFYLLHTGIFYIYMFLGYKIPLMVLWFINWIFWRALSNQYNRLNSKYKQAIRVVQVFKPYLSFEGSFDDYNLQKLIAGMSEQDKEMFPCDTKRINWECYLSEAHIPGVLTYGMKTK